MDLRHLQTFITVVDAGNFSRAATRMNMTQSTLSRHIAQLEQEWGVRLFARTGRGVALTPEGEVLLRNAKSLLQLADATAAEMRNLSVAPAGRVTVGLPPRIGSNIASTLVTRFRKAFPNATITLFEGMSQHLREQLVAGRIDLALMFDPSPAPRLSYATVWQEHMVLVGPRAAPRLPGSIAFSALGELSFVLTSSQHTIRIVVDRAAAAHGVALNVIAEVDSVRGMLSLVADGVAYSIVPEMAVRAFAKAPALQVAEILQPSISSSLVLAVPEAGASTRLTAGTEALLRQLDYSRLVESNT